MIYIRSSVFSLSIFFFLSVIITCAASAQANESDQTEKQLILTIGDYTEDIALSEALSWINITPTLFLHPEDRSNGANIYACALNAPCAITLSRRNADFMHINEKFSVDDNQLRIFLNEVAVRANIDPIDAKFGVDDNDNIITREKHQDGRLLNIDKSITKLHNGLINYSQDQENTIDLVYESVIPEVTTESANELGITTFLGEGRSDFSGSTKKRIHNIKTAASRFDGVVLAPNEELSFVKLLGEVDGEHGFEKELVIKDKETKPEYGGGICQVSTTLFRNAIMTGMEITQRRNHSYPVHYYTPIGFDATVYVPAPDFRFKNNTPGYILMQPEIEGLELIFRFYGTPDGRDVEMTGPIVTEKNEDGSMKTYFTQTVVDKDGETIIEKTFKSNYKSPKDYPNPDDVVDADLTKKPSNWSNKQWKAYKKTNGI